MPDKPQPDPMRTMNRIIRAYRTLPQAERTYVLQKLGAINLEEFQAATLTVSGTTSVPVTAE